MTRSIKTLSTLALTTALGASVLGGCASAVQEMPSHRMHPTVVAESVERLELYARPGGMSLSARDMSAVDQFIQTYAAHGAGPIFINRPGGHEDGLGVRETDTIIRTAMLGAGLNPANAQSGSYFVAPGNPAPIVVSYKTLRTVPQRCTDIGQLGSVGNNGATPQFGCVAAANLGAMISDPRQLLGPLPAGLPNAQRRQVIYDKYIQGATTAATRPAGQLQDSQSR